MKRIGGKWGCESRHTSRSNSTLANPVVSYVLLLCQKVRSAFHRRCVGTRDTFRRLAAPTTKGELRDWVTRTRIAAGRCRRMLREGIARKRSPRGGLGGQSSRNWM
ncbi:hypothetical protein PHLGIDRAFT_133402 [Phlebiopsis gigantea 11061_1 CR5-6]|uniref:Uncharacterized protein n=1 Tax=Phlebiopsis gigantea (strain 11061_1 CR5-6) TaxID=745531 RepID=A0A0C3P424_PHLG1|nr:hypothetical protein PHLGIDRAFT_133402 [Phlebiopsis gigantea 11061_1 CR5-6]